MEIRCARGTIRRVEKRSSNGFFCAPGTIHRVEKKTILKRNISSRLQHLFKRNTSHCGAPGTINRVEKRFSKGFWNTWSMPGTISLNQRSSNGIYLCAWNNSSLSFEKRPSSKIRVVPEAMHLLEKRSSNGILYVVPWNASCLNQWWKSNPQMEIRGAPGTIHRVEFLKDQSSNGIFWRACNNSSLKNDP